MSNATRKPGTSTRDWLTAARIEELRDELRGELGRLRRRLIEWPSEAWMVCQGRYMGPDDVQAELCDRMDVQCTQILAALDRVRDGTYGRCAFCKEPIPYGRLQVVPETSTCVTCGGLELPPANARR